MSLPSVGQILTRPGWVRTLGLLGLLIAVPAAADLKLPPATRARLGNGLSVVVIPTSRLPLVDFRMVVRAGSVDDPKGKEGLARLTAQLMTQGAARRDARQIAEDIAFVGGELDVSAGPEQMVATCEVLQKDFSIGLELFRDVIVSPTFPEEEVRRRLDETLGEIASGKNDPSTVADQALGPFLLGAHPLAHPVIGWQSTVGSLSREDVVAFHARVARPANALLAVVGDVDPKATLAALEKAFGSWKGAAPSGASYPAPAQTRGHRVLIVNKPEVTQTQIRLACIGVPRNHPDYEPIRVANTILGSGFTSRLVNEVRVNRGLTYGISSRWAMYRNAGTFGIYTFTRNETIRKTIDATLGELTKLLDQGPTQEELDKARSYITGQYPLGLQAPDDLAAQVLDVDFFGLEPNYIETFPSRIQAVGMADARRALKSYFCTDDLRILVVSNPEVARPQLEGLGTMEVQEPK